jgi:calcineurin-like phosphoesterase family protein
MSVWFTADPHFRHRFVAGLRGFDQVEDHDAEIAANWRSAVHPEDHVWVLGDLAVSSPYHALAMVENLPGTKHLIAGNHDACHPMHRNAHKWQSKYLSAFASVQPFARRRIMGEDVLLSHFPYSKDRHEARYMQYRLRDEGKWLLHGHTHQAEQRREGREIHVGVDAWDLSPVPLNTIIELMNEARSESEPNQ